jgi:cell wall-associated NlpC family hydrolase
VNTDAFIAAARTYLGVRFLHQGRSRFGVDCVGLAICAGADAGHPYIDQAVYPPSPSESQLVAALTKNLGTPLPKETPLRVGDIVRLRVGRAARHVAIVGNHPLGGLSFIHAEAMASKVIEHAIDQKWQRRIVEVYRVRD